MCILKYFFFFSSICVFLNVKTIYAVFSLILSFIFSACLFILGGATFLGFIIVVVYVGAVLVFFLFVTMMLDIRSFLMFNHNFFFSVVFLILNFLVVDIIYIYLTDFSLNFDFSKILVSQSNIVVIGYLLYTWCVIPLFLCAFILLVAMIGSIILLVPFVSQTQVETSKTQNISHQVSVCEFEVIKLTGAKIYYD